LGARIGEPWASEVIAASGPPADIASVLPAVAVQGLLSLSDAPAGSARPGHRLGKAARGGC